jgi:hypothetical protein
LKTPQESKKRLEDKMRGIDEVNLLTTLFGFLKDWL